MGSNGEQDPKGKFLSDDESSSDESSDEESENESEIMPSLFQPQSASDKDSSDKDSSDQNASDKDASDKDSLEKDSSDKDSSDKESSDRELQPYRNDNYSSHNTPGRQELRHRFLKENVDNWSWTSTPARTETCCRPEAIPLPQTPMGVQQEDVISESPMSEKLKTVFPTMKAGDKVKMKIFGQPWTDIQLTSRGGRPKGVNKYHWNAVDLEVSQEFGVHFDRLENFRIVPEPSLVRNTDIRTVERSPTRNNDFEYISNSENIPEDVTSTVQVHNSSEMTSNLSPEAQEWQFVERQVPEETDAHVSAGICNENARGSETEIRLLSDSTEERLNATMTNHIFLEVTRDRYKEPIVRDAMAKELKNWIDEDVFKEVDNVGQNILSTRWVINEKIDKDDPTKRICKARLVVRGYEEDQMCEVNDPIPATESQVRRTDSPTAEKRSIWILLNISVNMSWEVQSIDIKSAFLKSDALDRQLYVRPPIEVRKRNKIWLLMKPAYGLRDASRCWYQKLKEEILATNCKQSSLDSAVFYYYEDGKLQGAILIHVDDMLFAGSHIFGNRVISKLKALFTTSREESRMFTYVGLKVQQEGNIILLDQQRYTENIDLPEFSRNSREKSDLLSTKEATQYRSLVGQLIWLVTQSRPDLYFPVIKCSTRAKKPTLEDMLNAMRITRLAKANPIKIKISALGDLSKNIILLCFTDASYGSLNEKVDSTAGHIIYLSNGRQCSLVSWNTSKIKNVVTSAMEAETMALIKGVKEVMYVRQMISEIIEQDVESTKIFIGVYCDNAALVKHIMSDLQSQDVQLRKHIAWLREKSMGNKLFIKWLKGEHNIADLMTKERSHTAEAFQEALIGVLPALNPEFMEMMESSRAGPSGRTKI